MIARTEAKAESGGERPAKRATPNERLKNKKKLTPTGSRRKSKPDPRSRKRSAEGKVSLAQPFFSGKERLKTTDREAWKNQMSGLLAQKTVSVDMKGILENLNAQLKTFEATVGTGFETVDVATQINQMVSAIKQTMPGSAEMLANVNDAINNFKTALSISELSLSNSIGAISGLSETFREKMREHARNMKVLANVKAFEEFKKVKKSMIRQIELADERTAASTEASAASAGFVKVGNRFVKTGGTVMTTAFVDAYTRYDAEKNMTEQLENSGFAELNGDALVKFLSQSSDVEVESFFYVQKLALQVAFEKIMGKGSARDRANSRDEKVIGLLGMWTGAMPDSTAITAATAAAGNSYSSANARDRRNSITAVAGQGFGELGVWGTRPSGINGGFYVQLQMAGERVADMQAQAIAEAGELDPMTTMMAQNNFTGMLINSAYNVEMGSKVYGYDRKKLIDAQFVGMFKSASAGLGSALIASGVGVAVGVGIIALGQAIHVDTRTGEYGSAMTDQAAVGTVLTVGGAFAGGMDLGSGASFATTAGSSLISSGMVYDEKGRSQGFDLTGTRGDAALVTLGASIAGSYAGGLATSGMDTSTFGNLFAKSLVSGMVSTGVNTLSEYSKYKAYGAQYSNYTALGHADLSTGAGMLASALSGAVSEQAKLERDFRGNKSRDANRNDQNHRVATGLWGLYEGMRERFSAVGKTVSGWAGKIGSAISGAWNAFAGEGGFVEQLTNFFSKDDFGQRGVWETDKERVVRIAQQIGDGAESPHLIMAGVESSNYDLYGKPFGKSKEEFAKLESLAVVLKALSEGVEPDPGTVQDILADTKSGVDLLTKMRNFVFGKTESNTWLRKVGKALGIYDKVQGAIDGTNMLLTNEETGNAISKILMQDIADQYGMELATMYKMGNRTIYNMFKEMSLGGNGLDNKSDPGLGAMIKNVQMIKQSMGSLGEFARLLNEGQSIDILKASYDDFAKSFSVLTQSVGAQFWGKDPSYVLRGEFASIQSLSADFKDLLAARLTILLGNKELNPIPGYTISNWGPELDKFNSSYKSYARWATSRKNDYMNRYNSYYRYMR